ncbi:7TM diverse intracellular signaling domain-containing protein [Sphingobacterium sp.]|uniref:7TM diverse intracellular signaling domain-containing protein n=1 Tax=Sphingobacterium sp. TaxID=341027 RepID=UPI0028965150|nr:7TM diverse intracellular signaling domain-containing protein [Sphingobacterium sp.]
MKPNIIITILLLFSIATIHFGRDAITANNQTAANRCWADKCPVLITKENAAYNNPEYYYHHPDIFVPISHIKRDIDQKKGIFWLKKEILPSDSISTGNYVLSFDNLTYVNLTLINAKGDIEFRRKSGLFRRHEELAPKDNRDHFVLNLEAQKPYTILLRVKHSKGYTPVYNFRLQTELEYVKNKQRGRIVHSFMEGAIIVLLLYIAFAWIVSRYRPYIWIFLFLLSIGLYSVALQNFFIDFFFYNSPQLGWSLVSVFSRFAAISFYLLTIDFLQLKKLHTKYYTVACYIIATIGFTALLTFINNFYLSNYKQSNWINITLGIIHMLYFSNLFISLWRKIDLMQRFLAYGSVFFVTGITAMVYCALTLQEQAIQYVSMLTQFFALCITMLLLIGIRLKLRKNELDYHQSTESIVQERTNELKKANNALYEQQIQLLRKNRYIETLIDEVNHRVKNNLQLLYSLGSLYKMGENHGAQYNKAIQSMQDRIHAMMLVNQLLVYNQNSQLKLKTLVIETVNYLRQMHDPEKNVCVNLDIGQDWLISTNTSIPLALIITELLTNSYKYAFPKGISFAPIINLSIIKKKFVTTMEFEDNGVGAAEAAISTSFGIGLVKDLTRQIKGTVTIQQQNGFLYKFEFNNMI